MTITRVTNFAILVCVVLNRVVLSAVGSLLAVLCLSWLLYYLLLMVRS